MDQGLGGRDSELTCVCSRTGVSKSREILILQRRGMRTLCAKLTFNGLERYDRCEHWSNDTLRNAV